MSDEAKVTVEVNDPAADVRKAAEAERAKAAGEARAAHVAGLQNELGYLERQPKPNERRLAEVKRELDRYASEPQERHVETAADSVPPPVDEERATARRAARKTAAKK